MGPVAKVGLTSRSGKSILVIGRSPFAPGFGRRSLAKKGVVCIVVGVSELIFEVTEDSVDGGYCASALGFGIHTEAETLEELRSNVREAVDCYFDETMEAPKILRLHFVRDEILAP